MRLAVRGAILYTDPTSEPGSFLPSQRLHPTRIALGTTSGGSDKLKLQFTYKTPNNNDNNGNVLKQIITRPSLTALTQSYGYDKVNRLISAAESGAGTAWSRSYGYDRYGNRAVTANSGLPTSPLMPTATTNFSSSTNRLTLTGAGYDNSGNLTATSLGDTLAYDAENRLTSYTLSSATTSYKYGPQGRRVQKVTPTVTETYVYDAFGKLAAEYSTAAPTSGGTYYRTTDHLGSTRLVTKQDKSDADCFDYAPFGEEIPNTLGSRSSNACFAASFDGRHRFTGKERDDESKLDYFGARYFGASLGRFTSPDPLMASAKSSNPQTWNRYAYTLNNPLRYVDPDGLEVPDDCVQDPECTIVVKINVIYDSTVNEGQGLTTEQKQQFEENQIAKAQENYGTSNIHLDVTYTPGTYTIDANGLLQPTGLKSDSLNLLVSSGIPGIDRGAAAINRDDVSLVAVNFDEVYNLNLFIVNNTTSHEFAHHFLGHVYRPSSGSFGALIRYSAREIAADWRVFWQGLGFRQQGFREGLAPRRYAAPLNPQAIKPRQ